jgi:hypothetical protein
MTMRFYLVPVVSSTTAGGTSRSPEYFGDMDVPLAPLAGLEGLTFSCRDLGDEPYMMVGADVTPAQHTLLDTQVDVQAIPLNLDSTVGAVALTQIQNSLENANIPGTWITTDHTYREVVRFVLNNCSLLQRFQLSGIRLFAGAATLDTTLGQIPVATRNQLQDSAQSFGLSTQGIVGSTTIRDALIILVNQMESTTFAGETF